MRMSSIIRWRKAVIAGSFLSGRWNVNVPSSVSAKLALDTSTNALCPLESAGYSPISASANPSTAERFSPTEFDDTLSRRQPAGHHLPLRRPRL